MEGLQEPGKEGTDTADMDDLAQKVKSGRCILFLGAKASAPAPPGSPYRYDMTPPGGGELSEALANQCGYADTDRANLQRVSLFYQVRRSRERLIGAIAELVAKPDFEPSPALRMLAEMPFRIVITTNYDHLFDDALREARTAAGMRKHPIIRVYSPRREPAEEVPDDPSEEKPVLLKLHGDIDKPESLVVTEEDYLTFIERMSNEAHHPIHLYIRAKLRAWATLFIGYSLRDYNLRLLFKMLRWNMDQANFPPSYSVDPRPDDLIVAVWQQGRLVKFVKQSLWEFVPALSAKIKA